MTQQSRKNIFQSAINAVSSKDEKAALETAAKEMDDLEAKLAQTSNQLSESQKQILKLQEEMRKAQADAAKAQADLAQSQKDLQAARSEASLAQTNLNVRDQQLAMAKAQINQYLTKDQAAAAAAQIAAAERSRIIAEHTLTPDESLSHMALKYYGNAGEAYWRVIYEANKELIGPNPSRVRPGMVIKIPVLPEELKKK
jgi:septal ring factor EnvC (AmiA/AmiB activator)